MLRDLPKSPFSQRFPADSGHDWKMLQVCQKRDPAVSCVYDAASVRMTCKRASGVSVMIEDMYS